MKADQTWALLRHTLSVSGLLVAGGISYGLLSGQVDANDEQIEQNRKKIETIDDKIQTLSNQQGVLIHQQADSRRRADERHKELVKQLDRLTDAVTAERRERIR